jgi:hypothetical protein
MSFVYKGDSIRLTRELPEFQLAMNAEGTVQTVIHNDEGVIVGAEVAFYVTGSRITPTLPLDALEPVLTGARHRTAVFWGLQKPREQIIESAMHAVLDRGYGMCAGLNVVRLHYVSEERWWKWGDRMSDPTGALVTAASSWDGIVVALSGREGLQLEFRLAGRKGPALLVHERDEAFQRQSRESYDAMEVVRVFLALLQATDAEYGAFPVGSPWLADEDWPSLLVPPHYPDFFVLPQASLPTALESAFRIQKLTDHRAIATVLPMKFSPADAPLELKRSDRDLSLDALRRLKALGEKYYDQMYETHRGLTGLYSGAKDAFYDAISLANELGLKEECEALENRLDHVKAVFRSQFS